MNNKEFIATLSAASQHNVRDTQVLVSNLVTEMVALLEDEGTLAVQGFGTFGVKMQPERVLTNPTTGQRMLVPPRLVATFKACPALKERMQKGGND